jgi:hypothetical protein
MIMILVIHSTSYNLLLYYVYNDALIISFLLEYSKAEISLQVGPTNTILFILQLPLNSLKYETLPLNLLLNNKSYHAKC